MPAMSTPSSATSSITRAASVPPARTAATTASTITDPTYATPAGSAPAATVRSAMTMARNLFVLQTSSSARRLYLKTAKKLRTLKLDVGASPAAGAAAPELPAAAPAEAPSPSRLEYRPGGMCEAPARSAIARLTGAHCRGIRRFRHGSSTLVVGTRDQPRPAPEENVAVNPRNEHGNAIAKPDE